jgi:hypothetical protein
VIDFSPAKVESGVKPVPDNESAEAALPFAIAAETTAAAKIAPTPRMKRTLVKRRREACRLLAADLPVHPPLTCKVAPFG